MENEKKLKKLRKFWSGKKIFITGHTGFKGTWLCIMLNLLRSKIYGYSLNPKRKSLFSESVDKTAFLIPELKEFDYLIKMVGIWKKQELKELKKFLHRMKNVEPQSNINLTQIKSINNLVF